MRYKLTRRELEVLKLVSEGQSCKEVGRTLGLAEATVKVHRKGIIAKLGVKNTPHAVAVAMRRGLFDNAPSEVLIIEEAFRP